MTIIPLKDGRVFNLGQYGAKSREIAELESFIDSARSTTYESNEAEAISFMALSFTASRADLEILATHFLDRAMETLPRLNEKASSMIEQSPGMALIFAGLSDRYPERVREWRGI